MLDFGESEFAACRFARRCALLSRSGSARELTPSPDATITPMATGWSSTALRSAALALATHARQRG